MEDEWENEAYEEGEELFYDDDGAFGVDAPYVEEPVVTDL